MSLLGLRNQSIQRKLTLIVMMTSSIALVLSSVSFLVFDLVSFRSSLVQDLMTQSKMIAYNSAAAVAFGDVESASETLASLSLKQDIVEARLVLRDGEELASYSRSDDIVPERSASPWIAELWFNESFLEVSSDVWIRDENIGTLYVKSDLHQWGARAERYASILIVFVLISSVVAWRVAKRLQIVVSRPILHLGDTMRSVSVNKNYAIRAEKYYEDEIGQLIDGFNTMLSDIQSRDKALQRANEELKDEIIHRRRTQEELVNAKIAAEDASRAKSAFLANMSHELRTPLNAIIGYSEMLEEEAIESGNKENLQDVRRIRAAGKHLLSLINDVLDLSKIEAGKMTLHLETFAVKPLIEEIVTTLKPSAEKRSNRFEVNLAEDLDTMRADETRVRQILFNLLSNAFKFTERGVVSLSVNHVIKDSEQWIRFQVSDTGIGISADEQRNLFKEFSQADGSIARKYGGTGLGLAISQRFAQMMSGSIVAESEPDKGSTFIVDIPVVVTTEDVESDEQEMTAATSEGASATCDGEDTVLVIDDDPAMRDLMTRSLTRMGLNVVTAAGGEEGLRVARTAQPQLITLDVMMPGVDGWSVLNELKSNPELEHIPVIMVTIVDNQVMGVEKGASDYLVKPIDRERLAVIVEQHRTRVRPAA